MPKSFSRNAGATGGGGVLEQEAGKGRRHDESSNEGSHAPGGRALIATLGKF